MRPTITFKASFIFILDHQLASRTGTLGELFYAGALSWIVDKVFETVAFGGL